MLNEVLNEMVTIGDNNIGVDERNLREESKAVKDKEEGKSLGQETKLSREECDKRLTWWKQWKGPFVGAEGAFGGIGVI